MARAAVDTPVKQNHSSFCFRIKFIGLLYLPRMTEGLVNGSQKLSLTIQGYYKSGYSILFH
jgi:hypothetical protein